MRLTSPTKSVALEATIIRADGKVEPQGTVAYWHRNPILSFFGRLRNGLLRSGRVRFGGRS